MSIRSAVESSVPRWQGSGIEQHLSALGHFIVGVGSLKQGDTVAVVNSSDDRFFPTLNESGTRVLRVDAWRFLSSHVLPMPSGGIDVIFANMVLHHMRYPMQAISEMNRVLKSGGRLVMTDLGKYDDMGLKERRNDLWMGFYISDIRHWLNRAGFSNIIVNPVPYHSLGVDIKHVVPGFEAEIFLATGTA